MAETPRDVARRIGREYVEDTRSAPAIGRRNSGMDPKQLRDAFETMRRINLSLFEDIPIPVVFTDDDPYENYEDMAESVVRDGELRIFSGGSPHPLWDHDTEVISRAVHDWHGHLHLDVDFSIEGEYRKWEHSRTHYPAYCDRVLFTEVIGQLGAAIYLDDGYGDERFEQKIYAMSPEHIEDMARAIEDK